MMLYKCIGYLGNSTIKQNFRLGNLAKISLFSHLSVEISLLYSRFSGERAEMSTGKGYYTTPKYQKQVGVAAGTCNTKIDNVVQAAELHW